MSRFLAGFAAASLVWAGALAVLHLGLGWGPPPTIEEAAGDELDESENAESDPQEPAPRRRGGRRRAGSGGVGAAEPGGPGRSSGRVPRGEATTGDDLGEGRMRTIDGEGTGGEQQLSGAQIEAGFDGAMGRIRRCFLLAPGELPITGRIVFGLRIAGSGQVQAVQLSGPAALTTGDTGECLRSVARAIRFPPFDGPEMVVRYPILLE